MNKEVTLKNNIGYENLESQFQKIVSLRKNQTWMLIGRKGIGKRTLSMSCLLYTSDAADD